MWLLIPAIVLLLFSSLLSAYYASYLERARYPRLPIKMFLFCGTFVCLIAGTIMLFIATGWKWGLVGLGISWLVVLVLQLPGRLKITQLVLAGVAWVGVPGALIGWIAGFFGLHILGAVLWGLFIMFTYPRSRYRWGGKVDALTYFLAFVQAGIGGLVCFFVGQLTH